MSHAHDMTDTKHRLLSHACLCNIPANIRLLTTGGSIEGQLLCQAISGTPEDQQRNNYLCYNNKHIITSTGSQTIWIQIMQQQTCKSWEQAVQAP